MPYIGNIPLGEKNKHIVITKGSKSVIAELFRSLRTNIDFLLKEKKDSSLGNFVFITSTVAKEGNHLLLLIFQCLLLFQVNQY